MTTHLYTIARLEFTAAARLNWTRTHGRPGAARVRGRLFGRCGR